MTTTIATDSARAKLLFTGLYIITVGILFVVFMAFWKEPPVQYTTKAVKAEPVKNNSQITGATTLLHKELRNVQEAWMAGPADSKRIANAEKKFAVTLEGMEQTAASLKNEDDKLALKEVINEFKSSFDKTKAVVAMYASKPKDTVYANTGSSAIVDSLKAMLVDKEQTLVALQTQLQQQASEKDGVIASLRTQLQNASGNDKNLSALQTQAQTSLAEKDKRIAGLQTSGTEKDKKIADLQAGLKERDKTIAGLQNQMKVLAAAKPTNTGPARNNNDGSAEWRQKHAQLKSAYDNLASKNNALIKSYESLAQDNKRLTSELQIRRATGKG